MVLPLFYFGPISYFTFLKQNLETELLFEINENFIKQSYRNRCYILGSNKKLCLTIPIQRKDSTRILKDTKISYDFDWKKQHLKSIDSAYKSAPYYEYYEDSINLLYHKNEVFLIDFLLSTFHWTLEKLQLNIAINKTEKFTINSNIQDLRSSFHAKQKTEFENEIIKNNKEYYQLFRGESDFVENLSILDLLLNCGNTASNYL